MSDVTQGNIVMKWMRNCLILLNAGTMHEYMMLPTTYQECLVHHVNINIYSIQSFWLTACYNGMMLVERIYLLFVMLCDVIKLPPL